jgi:anti-sigma regulatory factor (Ser/Thr protein kinase)
MEAMTALAGDASSVQRARAFVKTTLNTWEMPDHAEVAVLLTSELVTNAVVHARSRIELRIRYQPNGVLRIEVVDESFREPFRLSAPTEATAGRGLAILDNLAARWGVQTLDTGKAVWFELVE